MILVKQKNGSYIPAYSSDWESSQKIKSGDEVRATKARSIKFHRLGFALLKLGFENQDKFGDFEIFRQVVTIKAGFVHFVTGKNGEKYPLPHSISFEKMNAEDFERWYTAIKTVIAKECKIAGKDIENEIENYF